MAYAAADGQLVNILAPQCVSDGVTEEMTFWVLMVWS